MIDENRTDHACRYGKKVCPVGPFLAGLLLGEPYERFVHERGRLQRVVGRLARHTARRETSELLVEEAVDRARGHANPV